MANNSGVAFSLLSVYFIAFDTAIPTIFCKLEDLTVLNRSPDLLNNVKIGQDQLRLIMKHILFYVAMSR